MPTAHQLRANWIFVRDPSKPRSNARWNGIEPMATAPDRVTVVTATAFETRAARAQIGDRARVVQAGIALRSAGRDFGSTVISCGLAGGLRDDLPTGTVLVPRNVRRPDGDRLACDPDLVEKLLRAARGLGFQAVDASLVTSARIVRGTERARW